MRSVDVTREPLINDRRRFLRMRSAPRASQACLACATSKTRCDNDLTCGRCRRRNIRCIRGVRLPTDLADWNDGLAYDRTAPDTPVSRQENQTKDARRNPKHVQENTEVNQENGADDSLPPPQTDQMANSTLTAFNFLPQIWDSGVSPQLFDLGSDIDWTLNIPGYDGLSSSQVSPLHQTAQTEENNPQLEDTSPAGVVDTADKDYAFLAFRQSIGRWTPDLRHYRNAGEQEMSSENITNLRIDMQGRPDPSITKEPLTSLARDRLVAMAIVSCEPGNVPAVVSAFPTVEVLEQLINISLMENKDLVEGFIHVPTFSKAECRPETLTAIIIDGATKSQSRAAQKFGAGLGEILSYHLYKVAERDIQLTRDLEYLQAFCTNSDMALWSGIRYKMELSGSTVGAVLNMMRVAGRYRRTSYSSIIPSTADVGNMLEKKWRAWVKQESFKRMVYFMYIRCVQEGFMTSTTGSHISTSELSLPLPESRELWAAQSATEWKEVYLRLSSDHLNKPPPSLLECMVDPARISQLPEIYDNGFAHLVQVYSVSSLVREFKQSQSIFSMKDAALSRETVIADETQEKRLVHILNTIRICHESSKSSQSDVWNMLRELASMHLHTYFDQIELFAGREGPEEAQTVYPILCSWFRSQSSRQTVWHAGQVLRYMRVIPPSNLHIFHAVACYHASLCLWIYGVFTKLNIGGTNSSTPVISSQSEHILLDGEETIGTQRWIASNGRMPMISDILLGTKMPHDMDSLTIPLDSTKESMNVLIEIIRKKFQTCFGSLPLLVQNICHLMRAIGEIRQPFHISTATGI